MSSVLNHLVLLTVYATIESLKCALREPECCFGKILATQPHEEKRY